jgi:hypothetical protein
MSKFDLENYETVQERIETFVKMYPNGSIITDVFTETRPDGRVEWICKASIYKDAQGVICATGWASEYEGANKFAPHNACELAETSARGRALLAIGIGQQASRDEVASARSKEEAPKPVQQDDPWAKGMEILGDALGAEPLANQTTYSCSHGVMVYSTGISKKNNKPWAAYKCPDNVQLCDPKWMKVG